jgi:hypothetical protein
MLFREALLHKPLDIFLENIRKAGFEGDVETIPGESSVIPHFIREPVDFVFIDADHEYDSVVKDLFAVRANLTPNTFLLGHDYNSSRRPGVTLAVGRFIRHYVVQSNVWPAKPEGIEHLQSLPDYSQFAAEVEWDQKVLDKRYSDAEYCRRHVIPSTESRTVSREGSVRNERP